MRVRAISGARTLTLGHTGAAEVICSVARLVTQSPLKGHFIWLDVSYEEARRLAERAPAPLDVFMELSRTSSIAYCKADDLAEVEN